MSNDNTELTELEEEVHRMVEIAEKLYEKELDGCSYKYGTILCKMEDWIGYNSVTAEFLEEWFKDKYYSLWQEIEDHSLCYSYRVVIELLDISTLDELMKEIINE